MQWFNTLAHNRWLEQETDEIFNFARKSVVPSGFGWLGNKGQIMEENGTHLWITSRMLHVFSCAALISYYNPFLTHCQAARLFNQPFAVRAWWSPFHSRSHGLASDCFF